jgi:hypothetical protein
MGWPIVAGETTRPLCNRHPVPTRKKANQHERFNVSHEAVRGGRHMLYSALFIPGEKSRLQNGKIAINPAPRIILAMVQVEDQHGE